LPADAQPDGDFPLPLLKKVQKSRGKEKERGYGKGVGDGPGQGVYQWEVCSSLLTAGDTIHHEEQVVAQVKEGAEGRGAVNLVAASLRNMVGSLVLSESLTDQS
jgi:hypothetical protein